MVASRRAKARRSYSRTGLNALKARVKVRGLSAIDMRTQAARELVGWRDEVLEDLGGAEAVSASQRAVVDIATRTKLYLDSLDAWLLEQPSLIVKRRRSILPVLRERQQIADSLARLLGHLGLERRARPARSLTEMLEATPGGKGP